MIPVGISGAHPVPALQLKCRNPKEILDKNNKWKWSLELLAIIAQSGN